jgi:hypothetical protein
METMSGLLSPDVDTMGSDGPHPAARIPAARSPRVRLFDMMGKRITEVGKRIKGGE